MQCELCGKESTACRQSIIEGVDMILCPSCLAQHGKSGQAPASSSQNIQRAMQARKRRQKQRDIYQEIQTELIEDWGKAIQKARQQKGLSREQLGFEIGESTSTVGKIENEDLRPSDKLIKKIEKTLEINLTEERKKADIIHHEFHGGSTLGDFIKTK